MTEQKIQIDGVTYIVTPFGATRALLILKRLVDAVGGPLARMVGSINVADVMKSNIDGEALALSINELATKLSAEGMVELIQELLQKTEQQKSIGGKLTNESITPENFDLVFAGKLGHIPKLVVEVVKLNFGNFLQIGGGGKGKTTE